MFSLFTAKNFELNTMIIYNIAIKESIMSYLKSVYKSYLVWGWDSVSPIRRSEIKVSALDLLPYLPNRTKKQKSHQFKNYTVLVSGVNICKIILNI